MEVLESFRRQFVEEEELFEGESVVRGVGQCLSDEDEKVREAAERFLSKKHHVTAIRMALKCLEHPFSLVRGSGIRVLGEIGKGDAQALSGIMRYFGEADTRSTACLALISVTSPLEASKMIFSRLTKAEERHWVPDCVAVLARKMPRTWLSMRAAQ